VKFYLSGIFKGEDHPAKKTELSKLNPLQRLVYLGLKLVLIPVVVISGLLYMFYRTLHDSVNLIGEVSLESVALWHTIGAYLILSFLIVHVYMTTTGHTPLSNTKAMITGYEEFGQESERRVIIK
jgi:thiosulfate reductase cytochrome b subunit